jgi:adenylate kinase family enzyme
MSRFAFITSEDFRESLESDYAELKACVDAKAWKSVHVLSGSILEAILVDYLIADGFPETDALKLMLAQAITECRNRGVLSQRAHDLSTVIRSYRNMIHPGLIIRRGEVVDEDGAKVAEALVDMVIKDISLSRKRTYGNTAEQITDKIINDSSAIAIVGELLKDAKPIEIERLLTIIPKRHFELEPVYNEDGDPYPPIAAEHLETCFRTAFNKTSRDVQEKTVCKFVSIIKEESEPIVNHYGTGFFRATDLDFLSPDEIETVKKHIYSRLGNDIDAFPLSSITGIGKFFNKEDVKSFIDLMVNILHSNRGYLEKEVGNLLTDVYHTVDPTFEADFKSHLDHHLQRRGDRQLPSWLRPIEELRQYIDWTLSLAEMDEQENPPSSP